MHLLNFVIKVYDIEQHSIATINKIDKTLNSYALFSTPKFTQIKKKKKISLN